MSDDQTCLGCGEDLPDNFESLETCPSCGADLWDDNGADDGTDVIDGKIIGAGLIAAVVGIAIWAGLAIGANREIGFLAWGIGGLIGWATMKAGGVGSKPAILAAILAFCSIVGGRVVSTQHMTGEYVDAYLASSEFKTEWMEMESDGMDFVKLKEPVDDEALVSFLVEHDYVAMDGTPNFTAEDLTIIRGDLIPTLELLASPGGYRQHQDNVRGVLEEELSLFKMLKENLGLVDLVFLALGIGTAFKLVMGR